MRTNMPHHHRHSNELAAASPSSLTGAVERLSQNSLRSEIRRLREIINVETVGVMVFDSQGALLDADSGFELMLGYNRQEISSGRLSWRMLTASHSAEAGEAARISAGATWVIGPAERALRRKDGSLCWMLVAGGELADGSRVEFCIDLTDRKKSEAALFRSNELLKRGIVEQGRELNAREHYLDAILNAVTDAIFTVDDEGKITSANQATGRMFGYPPNELPGMNIAILLPTANVNGIAPRSQQPGIGRASQIAAYQEMVGCRSDGGRFEVELACSAMLRHGLFVCIVRDVSERKKLVRLARNAAAHEKRRVGRELHDSVAQELAGLALIAERAACRANEGTPPDPETVMDLYSGLRNVLTSTRSLVRGFLPPTRVRAEEFGANIEELVRGICRRSNIACEIDVSATIPFEGADVPLQLYRIAAEAVANACRHSRAQNVMVHGHVVRGVLRLVVRDNGVGLPANAELRGAGLGIMQHRANRIGASLKIRSVLDRGTAVTCTVPANRAVPSGGKEAVVDQGAMPDHR